MKTSSPAAYPAGDLSLKASEENSNSVLGMVLWLKASMRGMRTYASLGAFGEPGSVSPSFASKTTRASMANTASHLPSVV